MYLIFDTETTGLPKNFNAPLDDFENWPRIVQLSWQVHDEAGNLLHNHDYIIRPEGFDIPFRATMVHGITNEIAEKEGKPRNEVLEIFLNDVRSSTYLIAHNIDFDLKVTGSEFLRSEKDNPFGNKITLDTMLLGTEFTALGGGKNGKFKSPTLAELYSKLFNEDFDEAHNAAADVNATSRAFFEMLRRGIINEQHAGLDPEIISHFRTNHPDPIRPFDITVRNQVNVKRGRKKTSAEFTEEVELGDYFSFHNHSVFSILQSTTKIPELVKFASKNNFPAVGMVDMGNMMGAFQFVSEVERHNAGLPEEEKEHKKLIPVLGTEVYISDRPEQKQFTKDDPDVRTQAVLLAKNFKGYQNLIKLSSLGFTKGFYFGVGRISKEWIKHHSEGIIALTGGLNGDVPNEILNYGEQRGEQKLLWWKETFGEDFYIQIQNHGLPEEEYLNDILLKLADRHGISVLAQNETFYTGPDDAEIQDILLCVKEGEKSEKPIGRGYGKRYGLPNKNYYLNSREQLKKNFRDYPMGFADYSAFLAKFEPYTLRRNVLLPKFEIPQEFIDPQDEINGTKNGENAYLKHLTYEGAKKRYGEITEEITQRIEFELATIANTGYPGYFLIVQDFCDQARKMGVSVGPGRGSAAGSVVAYCTGITNVDPIAYDLLFERFLNPERISMPDIDIDFDDVGRDDVIRWVIDKYGKDNVAQIITYSILGGKSAIKDAGRVLDVSIPETNNIAKLVPAVPGMNIEKALKKYDQLGHEDKQLVDEMKAILDQPDDPRHQVLAAAKKMEGAVRNTGIHACGVVITPEEISNLVPISIAAKDSGILVSQFDNHVAESAGLLKMDFLGLRTLTIIKDAIALIHQRFGDVGVDLQNPPLDDEKTYRLFQEGRTIGIFQYESPGMQKYMRDLKPTVFADLIAMNALYRPGPIKYIPNFINRKHGIEPIEYDLPENEEYLAETYGITVYQEQVMLLSQKLAGFTKGEADTLRKGMGKKDRKVLDKMYPKFIEGGKANHLDESKLNKIWKDWEAFASYAFNKSHSTCYALIGYHTAYLKANYPAEYMASVMSNNINNTKQITMFMEDCKAMGVDVLGPDVNESQYQFAVNEKGQIRFGLGAIKGIGEGPSEAIVKERTEAKFKDVYDFFERMPASDLNKRVAENLIFAGALDGFKELHRAAYFKEDAAGRSNLEKLMKYAQSHQTGKSSIENSLFADFAEEISVEKPKMEPAEPMPKMKELNKEKEIIGFYLSAHPLDEYRAEVDFLSGGSSGQPAQTEPSVKPETPLQMGEDNPESDLSEGIPDPEMEEPAEEESPRKNAEPKGPYKFLALDEIEAYKAQMPAVFPELYAGKDIDFRKRQDLIQQGPEFTVAGLVTEFTVRDGRKSGEKLAFLTLEDYTGSYSFRLGDRDYMKFREELALDRFVCMKIKYSPSQDLGNVYVNVTQVTPLADTLSKLCRKLIFKLNPEEITPDFILHIKQVLQNETPNTDSGIPVSFEIKVKDKVIRAKSKDFKACITSENLLALEKIIPKEKFYLN